jgi:hypothetical protein
MLRTILLVLGIWLLVNVMFVVVVTPPRNLRRYALRSNVISAAAAFFAMAPFAAHVLNSIRRTFRKKLRDE